MSRTEETFTGYIDTPIGLLEIKGTKKEIVSVSFTDKKSKTSCLSEEVEKCRKELKEYFEGKGIILHAKSVLRARIFKKKCGRNY